MAKRTILAAAGLLGLTACASDFEAHYREPDQFVIKNPGDTLTITGDQRAILVRPAPGVTAPTDPVTGKPRPGGPTVMCAEPVPDVALSSLAKVSATLSAKADALGNATNPSVTAEYLNQLSVTAAELSGRTSTVLLARDFMYRLCELSANYKPDSEEYKFASKNFTQILKTIETLAKADKADADAKKILAKAKVDTLTDQMWLDSLQRADTKSKKIDLIVAKSLDNGKVSVKKVDDLIAKADKETDKVSAQGQQTLKAGAAMAAESGDIRDFRDALIDLSTGDLEALWKVAQKS